MTEPVAATAKTRPPRKAVVIKRKDTAARFALVVMGMFIAALVATVILLKAAVVNDSNEISQLQQQAPASQQHASAPQPQDTWGGVTGLVIR
jgi:cell division protein FtsN